MRFCFVAFFVAGSVGCSGNEPDPDTRPDSPDEPEQSLPPAADYTVAMFDPDHVLRISIEIETADWDVLRNQARNFFDIIGSSCLEEPPVRPFTYFPATVTIDGEVIEQVGVRKKGFFGSLSSIKPSLKLKFSEYREDQRFSGLKRMTLNNAKSDRAYVTQCIGYDLFAKAGVPSPRCSFATVEVNGEDLGLFVHVESLKKQFIDRHFSDNDGNLYEGAISDFRPGWDKTFQIKTNKLEADRSDIVAVTSVLEDSEDSALAAALQPLVDVDQFIDFWAMEVLISHPDGYARNTNNFYIYNDPTSGQFHFIPWGIDAIMNLTGGVLPWEENPPPKSVWAEGALTRRLYQVGEFRTQYLDRLQYMLDNVWVEDDLHAEVDRMEALITPFLHDDEQQSFQDAIAEVREFVTTRRAELEASIAEVPTWDRDLREPLCVDVLGSFDADFSTTWDNLTAPDPFAVGTGTWDMTLDATPIVASQVGSQSGVNEDGGTTVQVVALTGPTEAHLAVVGLTDPADFVSDKIVPLDWSAANGFMLRVDFSVTPAAVAIVGLLGDGEIRFGEVSTTTGQPVVGSLSAVIYESIF